MIETIYTPKPNETQLTFRALLAGCLLGSMVSMINIYLGLQTGWSTGAGLIAAILGFAAMKPLFPDYSILENNITETAGAAAGSMSTAVGIVALVPALDMLGKPMSLTTLYIWGFSVGLIGIFFIAPLRKQILLIDKLRFPSGIATAETIVIMHENQGKDNNAMVLIKFALIAGAITLFTFFVPVFHHIDLFAVVGLSAVGFWGFNVLTSPMMFGAGMLMGIRVGVSLLLGAIIAWGIITPIIVHFNWVSGPLFNYKTGAQGWLLWPGVTLMTVDSLMTFALTLPRIIQSFHHRENIAKTEEDIPSLWWISGLAITSVATTISLKIFFHIPILVSIIGIVLSSLLASIATRATGETDINPLSAVSKVTQLVYAGISPGQTLLNLMGAGLTSAGATSAGDMMSDLKTGLLLNASPKKQFISQCIGSIFGIIFSVPLYFLFKKAYDIGGPNLPAPAAHAWKAFAEVLTQGVSALPQHCLSAVVISAGIAIILSLLSRVEALQKYLPSNTAMGIAFIIPAFYPMIFFAGAIFYLIWQKYYTEQANKYLFPVASGLIVGEGLMGVCKAGLILMGVKPLFSL